MRQATQAQIAFARGWQDHDKFQKTSDTETPPVCPYTLDITMSNSWQKGWEQAAEFLRRHPKLS
jgi:ribosome modulation factor